MKLVFQNSMGNERTLADVEDKDEAMRKIKKFCLERDFKIPYTRTWGDLDKDGIWFDVGSWSEKFKLTRD